MFHAHSVIMFVLLKENKNPYSFFTTFQFSLMYWTCGCYLTNASFDHVFNLLSRLETHNLGLILETKEIKREK